MRKKTNHTRSRLLATASAAALVSALYGTDPVLAGEPPVWIELGWHTDHVEGIGEIFSPPFQSTISGFASPTATEQVLSRSYGDDGKISFRPGGADWVFSFSVRYGRARGDKSMHQEVTPTAVYHTSIPRIGQYGTKPLPPADSKFLNVAAKNADNHYTVDFQAGKDVGLGMLGNGGVSILSAGLRFARLSTTSSVALSADPNVALLPVFYTKSAGFIPGHGRPRENVHTYEQSFSDFSNAQHSSRSFHGIGPSISWDASAPIHGDPRNGEFTLDWGLSAAALFGRQRVQSHRQTSAEHHCVAPFYDNSYLNFGRCPVNNQLYNNAKDSTRSRSILVPNLVGSVGVSYRFRDFKVSLGYRADVFLRALDAGIDARHEVTRGYYGPFASVSVGLE